MSIRSEFIDGNLAQGSSYGLIYTEVLGWVDLGHAQGTDVRNLWAQMLRGESQSGETYDVTYKQSMVGLKRHLTVGKSITWRLKKRPAISSKTKHCSGHDDDSSPKI